MSNAFFNASGNPSTGSQALSSIMRAEFAAVAAGCDLLPTLSGNGNKLVAVNAGATALAATSTPVLGTPTSGTLTNCTGLPLTTGITGTLAVTNGGTGRATSTTAYALLAAGTTATGVQQSLAAGATTEILVGGGAAALPVWTTATGSGAPVRATSPTLVTPVLGAATATSINGVTISSTTGTLTITNGKSLSVSNTLTLSGTDGTSLNINAVATLNSGTYTPTISNTTNVATSTSAIFQWLRIGNVVTVSGAVTVDPTTTGDTRLSLSLPVASDFTTATQCSGTATYDGPFVGGDRLPFKIAADVTNNVARLQGGITADPGSEQPLVCIFTYLVQ